MKGEFITSIVNVSVLINYQKNLQIKKQKNSLRLHLFTQNIVED